MPQLQVADAELYYETTGEGPALIFAHGLGGNYLAWWQQIAYFRDRYTCITFSHRGFARSVESANSQGPVAYVDDLAALIEHLELDDVRLVAQSMGGWACLGYALREPERVRGLVMAATAGSLDHPEIVQAYSARANEAGELIKQGIHPACGDRMAREQPALHFLYQQMAALNSELDVGAVVAALRAMCTTQAEELAGLAAPLLCVTGAEDALFATEGAEAFAMLVPGARLERVPEAGHSVYFERPETFNRVLEEFFGQAG